MLFSFSQPEVDEKGSVLLLVFCALAIWALLCVGGEIGRDRISVIVTYGKDLFIIGTGHWKLFISENSHSL